MEILCNLCAFVGKTWNTAVQETAVRYGVFFWNNLFTWAVFALAACIGWFVSTKVGEHDGEAKWIIRVFVGVVMLMITLACGDAAFYNWVSAETPTYTLIKDLVSWY